jgi:hypothetical protein
MSNRSNAVTVKRLNESAGLWAQQESHRTHSSEESAGTVEEFDGSDVRVF